MTDLDQLLKNNRQWAERVVRNDVDFFKRLTNQQAPEFLWIGCSDSRVPANQISGLLPGEVFVHRNLANVILPDDPNCLAVVEFAVKVLKVRHIIVCGHYGCGGVRTAMQSQNLDLVDDWVSGIRELYQDNSAALDKLDDMEAFSRLCELNVLHQLQSLCNTQILREAWEIGQDVTVHGCIYNIEDGILHDLDTHVNADTDISNLNT